MANVFSNGGGQVDNEVIDSGDLLSFAAYGSPSATSFGVFVPGDFAIVFTGSGFNSYTGNFANSGVINSILHYDLQSGTVLTQTWSGLAVNASDVLAALQTNDDAAVAGLLFGGDDTISGSAAAADNLWGYGGADIIVPVFGVAGDHVNGGAGADTIVAAGMLSGDAYDGGADADTLVVALGGTLNDPDSSLNGFRTADLTAGLLQNFEGLSFAVGSPVDQIAIIGANQIGAGLLSTTLAITESAESNIIEVHAAGGALDLSGWTFNAGWQGLTGGEFNTNDDAVFVVGSAGVDTITGSSEGDRIEGQAGADVINGGAGDDLLDGGAGQDQLHGGEGDDFLDVVISDHVAGETYDGGNGIDLLYLTYDSGQTLDLSTSTLASIDRIEFDSDGNVVPFLSVNVSGAQALSALSSTLELRGSDTSIIDVLVITAASAVTLDLSNWNLTSDWINGDRVAFVGSSGADTFTGTTGFDVMNGGAGADTLNGFGGDDFIIANGAVSGESYTGGAGTDTLVVERSASATGAGMFTGFFVSDYSAGAVATLERLHFGNPLGGLPNQTTSDKLAIFSAAEAQAFASNLLITGVTSHSDVVEVNATGGVLDLSGWQFSNWNSGNGGALDIGEDLVYVVGSSSVDTLTGTNESDRLEGNGGADVLAGGAGIDTLDGGLGDDLLNGGAGADTMIGGDGNDTYFVDNLADVITENSNEGIDAALVSVSGYTIGANVEVAAIQGGGGLTLTGNSLSNVLYGAAGGDTLNGGDGDDTLQGGAGADTMNGGLGNDTFYVAQAGDTVVEASGQGTDATIVQMTGPYTLAANVEIGATFLGSGVNITGNGLDNQLYGNAGADTLNGAVGNDFIQGAGGSDTMIGGTGDDTYFLEDAGDTITESSNEGSDAVIVFTSSYTLAANVEVGARFLTTAYTLTGNGLDNQLYGNNGDDTLSGGDGNDTMQGGAGNDTMVGGLGNDTYLVEQAGDVVTENSNEGNDAVIVLIGSYTLAANVEVGATYLGSGVSITGNGLDNRLYGNTGADTLNGAAGADLLDGGAGADTLTGGTENDIFFFVAGQANGDTITDFAGNGASAGDQLRFAGYGTSGAGASFVQLDATHWQINSADGTIHDTITLSNSASVDVSDWLFV